MLIAFRSELVGEFVGRGIQFDIVAEEWGNAALFVYGLPWTCWLAGATVDAFVGMDIKLIGKVFAILAHVFVYAIYRARLNTGRIQTINT